MKRRRGLGMDLNDALIGSGLGAALAIAAYQNPWLIVMVIGLLLVIIGMVRAGR